MAFNVEEAFAQFSSPEEVLEAKRQARRERRLVRTKDLTVQERAADFAGESFARAAKSLAGVKDRDVEAAKELQGAFATISAAKGIPETDGMDDEEIQRALTEEQRRIAETGAYAEAQYIKEGLSEDEARLAAMDDVIAGAQMPEVARSLITMRGQMAAEIREKRGRINVLKAEAKQEALDTRVAEAEAAAKEAELETFGLEYLELQTARDSLIRETGDPKHPKVQEVERRMAKLEERPGDPGEEDGVLKRKNDLAIMELGASTEVALNQIANVRDLVNVDNFAKTSVSALDKVVDNLLTEVSAVDAGFGSWMREKLEEQFGDFSQYGENKARYEAMANLLTLTQTNALIKGIPSNFDVGLIEKTLAQGVKDPQVFVKVMDQQGQAIVDQFRSEAWHRNRHEGRNANRVNEVYTSRFVDQPRKEEIAREQLTDQEFLDNFDPATATIDDLIRADALTRPQEQE